MRSGLFALKIKKKRPGKSRSLYPLFSSYQNVTSICIARLVRNIHNQFLNFTMKQTAVPIERAHCEIMIMFQARYLRRIEHIFIFQIICTNSSFLHQIPKWLPRNHCFLLLPVYAETYSYLHHRTIYYIYASYFFIVVAIYWIHRAVHL